jgi:hypothetical protein
MKRPFIVLSSLAVLLGAGALYYALGGGHTPAGQPQLVSLTADNFSTLETQFNAASDSVRVILLMSPT